MRNVFARGAVAGALAGLVTGIVSFVFVEPTISRAIALEGAAPGPVSRGVQRAFGLTSGTILAGVALGLLFALAFRVLPSVKPAWDRAVGLGLGGFAAVFLIPQLRYPANPPGVGDAATIVQRTSGYVYATALGVAVLCLAYFALRRLAARGMPAYLRQPLVLLGSVITVGIGYRLLPSVAVDYRVPANLLAEFRLQSLGIQLLLMTGLTIAFGVLSERSAGVAPVPSTSRV